MKQRPRIANSIASPLRQVSQRFALAIAVIGGIALAVMGRNDVVLIERARLAVLEYTAPVFYALSAPVATGRQLISDARGFFVLRETNARLARENALLAQWENKARELKLENEQLRQLLNIRIPSSSTFVTAPLVAEIGGQYTKSAIIVAGRADGIALGDIALGDKGVIGRIQDAGDRASRILLLTDINSRLPVMTTRDGNGAILAGKNDEYPELILMKRDSRFEIGDQLVTSGAGGVVPQGLPVGMVVSVDNGRVVVRLAAAADDLRFVRVVNDQLNKLLSSEPVLHVENAGRPALMR